MELRVILRYWAALIVGLFILAIVVSPAQQEWGQPVSPDILFQSPIAPFFIMALVPYIIVYGYAGFKYQSITMPMKLANVITKENFDENLTYTGRSSTGAAYAVTFLGWFFPCFYFFQASDSFMRAYYMPLWSQIGIFAFLSTVFASGFLAWLTKKFADKNREKNVQPPKTQ